MIRIIRSDNFDSFPSHMIETQSNRSPLWYHLDQCKEETRHQTPQGKFLKKLKISHSLVPAEAVELEVNSILGTAYEMRIPSLFFRCFSFLFEIGVPIYCRGRVVKGARLWRRKPPYCVISKLGFAMRRLENSVNPAVNGYLFSN